MKNMQAMSLQNPERVAVTFREVAVHFTSTEWECLNVQQRELYLDVMMDVHKALISLGYEIMNSQILFRIKKEEKEYVEDQQDMGHESSHRSPSTSSPAITPDIILVIKKEEEASDWQSYGEEASKIQSAGPPGTSESSLTVKEEEEPCSRAQDMNFRRIKQEETSPWDCLTLPREGHIQDDANPEYLGMDQGRITQAEATLWDPDTARGGGTLKEQNSGVTSPTFKQHMSCQEEKSIQTDLMNKYGGHIDPWNVKEDILVASMGPQNKRKLNNNGEMESSIMHKRKSSKELNIEEQESGALSGLSTQVTGNTQHQDLRVIPNIDPSNVLARSLSGQNLWKRTLQEISSDSSGSELLCPLEPAAGGSSGTDIHQNSWTTATDKSAGCSSRRALQLKNWSNTLDEVAECSVQAVLWQNEQTCKLEGASRGSRGAVASNDVWKYTSDEGALDSSGIECSQMTWGTGKDNSSRKTFPLPAHDKSFLMIQPDAGIKEFLSDLREDQRQTIRRFMKILLNVIDEECVVTHTVSPLLPPQSHTIQLQTTPVLTIQPPSVQMKSDQNNKSIHLHSSQKPAKPQPTQLRTAQPLSVHQQPSASQTFQSCVAQQPSCQRQHIQMHSIQCIPSQPVQPQSIPSRSVQPQPVHPRPVQPHSLHTPSSPLCSSHSRPVQSQTIQPRAVPPRSIQLQTVQPLNGQLWFDQPHSMDSQPPSALVVPPPCCPPQPIQSPTLCKTSLLQGSTTSEKIPLLVNPKVSERFSSVTVDKQHLRLLLMAAEGHVKKQAAFLLNGLIKLLFKKEELACSDGLGLRGKKSNSLDQVKVDAMREFLHSTCVERKWNQLDGNLFTRIITNKISNARRDLKQGKQGLKGVLDTVGHPQANTRSGKNMHCTLSSAAHHIPPLQTLDNNQGQGEMALIKDGVQTDSDSEDCILTS